MGVVEQSPDSSELLVEVKAVFNGNFLASSIGLFKDSNDHLMCILGKHRENVVTQCGERVDAVCRLAKGRA